MSEYRPLHQTQVDDNPRWRWVNCGLNSIGMATDKDSLGLVRPDPNVLRAELAPDNDGVTMAQALAALEQAYGWELAVRTLTPEELAEYLSEHAGVMLQTVRGPMGDFCGSTFDGPHSVYVQQYRGADALLFDPLCPGPRWMAWNKIVAAGLGFGALIGMPTKMQVAITRPGRIEPLVHVSGPFFRYHVVDGLITGRSRKESGGFTALTQVPVSLRWPARSTRRTLVRIVDPTSAYNGWYVEPLASTVRYIGEL